MLARLVRIIVFVILLGLGGAYLVAANLDKIVRGGVEKGGSLVLGVPTTLEGASVSLLKGRAALNGLALGSPKGFRAPEMLRVGHARVDMDLWSLRRRELVVNDVLIDGPEITLEFAGGKTNWGVLLQRLKGEPSAEERASETKMRVDRIVIVNGRVRVEGIPFAESMGVPLPRVEIKDLRTADGGALTAGKVLAGVVESLYGAIGSAVKGRVPGDLESLRGRVTELRDKARDVRDDAEKARGLIKGILGGEKDR